MCLRVYQIAWLFRGGANQGKGIVGREAIVVNLREMDFNFRTINSYMPQWGSLFVENISLSAIFSPAGKPIIKVYKIVILNFAIEITDCPVWGK